VVGQLTQRAAAQVRVLIGACDPLSTPCPLGPLVDIAATVGGALNQMLSRALSESIRASTLFAGVFAELGR
jgi:hypothetical protein